MNFFVVISVQVGVSRSRAFLAGMLYCLESGGHFRRRFYFVSALMIGAP